MKKKNLAILLIMPFLVALFGIATIKTAFNVIDNDVVRIDWEYRDNELFEVGSDIMLKAEGVVADKRYPASEGNRLVWEVENADDATEPHATAYRDDNTETWYLKTLTTGKVTITCTTEKRNVAPMTMTGVIFKGNAFVINTVSGGSGQNVDPVTYFGEYDLKDGEKQEAVVEFAMSDSSGGAIVKDVKLTSATDNLDVDLSRNRITIRGAIDGMSSMTLRSESYNVESTYEFKVVEDGINVYTYDDLLYCTNKSEDGEIAVLRTNFESKDNIEGGAVANAVLFGRDEKGFGFDEDVYRFETTYNGEFIDAWNEYAESTSGYEPVDKRIIAGLRVRKDIYGNGFTVNLHNLCFPTSYTTENGVNHYYPSKSDLFKGPKPFYLIGDPNNTPLVTAFGQDNVGVYVDGDGITLNDVKIKNCDFGLVVDNLDSTGTVVEVHGDGNVIRNSVLSNGKNILRSFSSKDLAVENCILSTGRNFLLSVGSNEYEKNEFDDTTEHTFYTLEGGEVKATLTEFLEAEGDKLLTYFIAGFSSAEDMGAIANGGSLKRYPDAQVKRALHALQDAFARSDAISEADYKGSTAVKDTIFYRSGVASIGVDTMFNGPFLYSNKPSIIQMLMSILGEFGKTLPQVGSESFYNVSGSSYPVTVDISGDTRFFDYKTLDEWDISGLIDQNISTFIASMGLDLSLNITIDDIFPLKSILTDVASANDCIYVSGGTKYINVPVAFYGGGTNLSKITETGLTSLTDIMNVDLLDRYLMMNTQPDWGKLFEAIQEGKTSLGDLLGTDKESRNKFIGYIKEVLTKTVTTVTGFEPFKFQFINSPDGLFDMESGKPLVPDYRTLQKNSTDKEKNNG